MSTRHNIFAKITKAEPQADGTIIVEGIASSGSRDVQGEVVTPAAMKAALPEYMRFPALREMHDSWAAGKTLQARVDDADGCTYIRAKVVDKDAIQKVREGVYQGFSIGGHVPDGGRNSEDETIIEQIQLVEISLVDRPANPDAVIHLFKADASAKESSVDPKKQQEEAAQKEAAAKALEADAATKAAAEKAAKSAPAAAMGKDDLLQMARQLIQQACKDDDAGGSGDDVAAGDDVDSGDDSSDVSAADDVADAAKDDDVSAAAKDDDVAEDDDVAAAAAVSTKKAADVDELQKAAAALRKVTAENTALRKQVATLELKLATKGALKRVPVSKADDHDGEPDKDELADLESIAKSNPAEAAVVLLQKVHRRGGMTAR